MTQQSVGVTPAADSTAAEVLYDARDHIATITLNAPERMNTISRRCSSC